MAIVPSALAVFQAAFPMVGCDVPESIDDDTPEAVMARATYEIFVKEALERHAFTWNKRRATMVYQEDLGDNSEYRYAYQFPADMLSLRYVEQGGYEFRDFIVEEGRLLCNLQDADNLVAIYSYRAEEILWPADFTDAMVDRLASRLATGLLDRERQGANLERSAERKLLKSIRRDKRQDPGRDPYKNANLQRKWQSSGRSGRSRFYGKTT